MVRRDVIARAGGAGAASENPQNDGKNEFVVKIPHAFVVCCVLLLGKVHTARSSTYKP